MYIPRYLQDFITRISRSFPVILLTGPRQVGKTTLLQYLASAEHPPRSYVSLDEYGPQLLARSDPALFLQRHPPPVVIEEIQHAPNLLSHIKPRIDKSGKMGQYWLTGSQQFQLMTDVSESLAGRVGIIKMLGFSLAEERGLPRRSEAFRPDRITTDIRGQEIIPLFERIVRGSLPRFAQADPPPIEAYYGSYMATYVERDVRLLKEIANLDTFRRFVTVAAARVGQLLNYSDLARDVGIAVSTAREWLHTLEATLQIILLRPYFANLNKRQIKTPKLYFSDTGLVCYLTGWHTAKSAASGAMAGQLLECWAVSELYKSYWHRGREAPLWYYRDKEKREVDVLIAEEGRVFPLEIKLAGNPSKRDAAAMEYLERNGVPCGPGVVLCPIGNPYPITEKVSAYPVSEVW